MKRIYIYSCISIFLLLGIFVNSAVAQGNHGSKRQNTEPICHNGMVIWVNSNAVQAHLDHGDVPAVKNSAGQMVCPCDPPAGEEPPTCWNGDVAEWDNANCRWMPFDCPPELCEPTCQAPGPGFRWDEDCCAWALCEPLIGCFIFLDCRGNEVNCRPQP